MLSRTGMSFGFGKASRRRDPAIANNAAVAIIERMATVESGGK